VKNDPSDLTDPSGLMPWPYHQKEELQVVGKRLVTAGKIADLDAQIDGATPYKELATAAVDRIKTSYDSIFTKQGVTLSVPEQAGTFIAESAEAKSVDGETIAKGTSRWQSDLIFFEWDIKATSDAEAEAKKRELLINEKLVDKRPGPQPDPIQNASYPVGGQLCLVVKLKKPAGGATHRIILVDAPGTYFQIKPYLGIKPTNFKYYTDGTPTVEIKGLAGSTIKWSYLLEQKDGVATSAAKQT
jgi:hypothetical protein